MVFPRSKIARKPDSPRHIDPRRPAEAQALVLHKVKDLLDSFGIRNAIAAVDGQAFEVFGDPPLTNTFGD